MRSPSASRNSCGNVPGDCNCHDRHRRASTTPSATIAAVGQASTHRRQVPQPSGTGSSPVGCDGSVRSASVSTAPSTNQLPLPGSNRLELLPNQPRPARYAAARSTRALSSASTTARHPALRRSVAIISSAERNTASWSPTAYRATTPNGPERSASPTTDLPSGAPPSGRLSGIWLAYRTAPTTSDRAPINVRDGSVERSGSRYVNCMSAWSPTSRRDVRSPSVLVNGVASEIPTASMPFARPRATTSSRRPPISVHSTSGSHGGPTTLTPPATEPPMPCHARRAD